MENFKSEKTAKWQNSVSDMVSLLLTPPEISNYIFIAPPSKDYWKYFLQLDPSTVHFRTQVLTAAPKDA